MATYWLSRWHMRLADTVLVSGLVLVFQVVGDGSIQVVTGFVPPAVA